MKARWFMPINRKAIKRDINDAPHFKQPLSPLYVISSFIMLYVLVLPSHEIRILGSKYLIFMPNIFVNVGLLLQIIRTPINGA